MDYRYKCENKNIEFDMVKEFKKSKDISIILPTYNEQECIKKIIKEIRKVLKGKNYEIIIIDDNSKDKTSEIIDSYNINSIVALHRYNEKGILSAIRDGVRVARSNIIVMMDADFSHPPEKIIELLKYVRNYDLVSCSRFAKGGKMEAPFMQKYTTIVFNFIIRLIFFNTGLTDFTGGFHVLRRNKFLDLKFKYPSCWGEFDIELLSRAHRKGYKIKEIPYTYNYRQEGKSKSQNYLKYAFIYWKMALKLKFLR